MLLRIIYQVCPPKKESYNHDIATRSQALGYKVAGLSNEKIKVLTGLGARTVNAIQRKAITLGFNPKADQPRILDIHVCDAPRSGRPQITPDEAAQQRVLAKVLTDRFGVTESPVTLYKPHYCGFTRAPLCSPFQIDRCHGLS